eukprot:3220212-Rhodomonas_salina.1
MLLPGAMWLPPEACPAMAHEIVASPPSPYASATRSPVLTYAVPGKGGRAEQGGHAGRARVAHLSSYAFAMRCPVLT